MISLAVLMILLVSGCIINISICLAAYESLASARDDYDAFHGLAGCIQPYPPGHDIFHPTQMLDHLDGNFFAGIQTVEAMEPLRGGPPDETRTWETLGDLHPSSGILSGPPLQPFHRPPEHVIDHPSSSSAPEEGHQATLQAIEPDTLAAFVAQATHKATDPQSSYSTRQADDMQRSLSLSAYDKQPLSKQPLPPPGSNRNIHSTPVSSNPDKWAERPAASPLSDRRSQHTASGILQGKSTFLRQRKPTSTSHDLLPESMIDPSRARSLPVLDRQSQLETQLSDPMTSRLITESARNAIKALPQRMEAMCPRRKQYEEALNDILHGLELQLSFRMPQSTSFSRWYREALSSQVLDFKSVFQSEVFFLSRWRLLILATHEASLPYISPLALSNNVLELVNTLMRRGWPNEELQDLINTLHQISIVPKPNATRNTDPYRLLCFEWLVSRLRTRNEFMNWDLKFRNKGTLPILTTEFTHEEDLTRCFQYCITAESRDEVHKRKNLCEVIATYFNKSPRKDVLGTIRPLRPFPKELVSLQSYELVKRLHRSFRGPEMLANLMSDEALSTDSVAKSIFQFLESYYPEKSIALFPDHASWKAFRSTLAHAGLARIFFYGLQAPEPVIYPIERYMLTELFVRALQHSTYTDLRQQVTLAQALALEFQPLLPVAMETPSHSINIEFPLPASWHPSYASFQQFLQAHLMAIRPNPKKNLTFSVEKGMQPDLNIEVVHRLQSLWNRIANMNQLPTIPLMERYP